MPRLLWTSAFLDLPADRFEAGVQFWSAVTGYRVSEPRGDHLEFATLVPPVGDDFLRVQRLGDGGPRVHLDLHVEEPRAAADEAVDLGATEVADHGYVVMRSPGGLTFCFVSHPAATVPPPAEWADGGTSRVDQVCLDISPDSYEREAGFWAALTGWPRSSGHSHPEFERLRPPPGLPLELLLQRLDEPEGELRAHLDLACADREAEVRRHVRHGAVVVAPHEHWTVLRDPAGASYCITDRVPT